MKTRRDFEAIGAARASEIVRELTARRRSAPEWSNQSGFGAAVGVSGQTVSQTELEHVSPKLALMCAWASALGLRLELVPVDEQDELVTLPVAELGDEPTAGELVAGELDCPACAGEGVVEARDGQTNTIVYKGRGIVPCHVCAPSSGRGRI